MILKCFDIFLVERGRREVEGTDESEEYLGRICESRAVSMLQ